MIFNHKSKIRYPAWAFIFAFNIFDNNNWFSHVPFLQDISFEWWPRNGREHWIPYHSQKKSPFIRNSFSFLFLSIPFFVENYITKAFLVKFDKEQIFFFIPAILFLYVPFLFVPRVPEKSPVGAIISFFSII